MMLPLVLAALWAGHEMNRRQLVVLTPETLLRSRDTLFWKCAHLSSSLPDSHSHHGYTVDETSHRFQFIRRPQPVRRPQEAC